MQANKTRVVTDAKYKTGFYSTLDPWHKAPRPDEVMQRLQEDIYSDRKHAIDRKYYSSTYQLSYGKEQFSPI